MRNAGVRGKHRAVLCCTGPHLCKLLGLRPSIPSQTPVLVVKIFAALKRFVLQFVQSFLRTGGEVEQT